MSKEADRRWREKNRKRINEYNRERYHRLKNDPKFLEKKRERDRISKRIQRAKNPKKAKEQARSWWEANKHKRKEYNAKQWERIKSDPELLERERARSRIENMLYGQVLAKRKRAREYSRKKRREAWAEGTTRYQKEVTPGRRQHSTEYMKSWRASNPEKARRLYRKATQNYRDKRGARAAIDTYAYKMIRLALIAADSKSKYFPGYTGKQLKHHILSQLPEDWSIFDYGEKWEIDHIRPVDSFEYTSIEDEAYKQCWALKNLRPLCKVKNRQKRAQLDYPE